MSNTGTSQKATRLGNIAEHPTFRPPPPPRWINPTHSALLSELLLSPSLFFASSYTVGTRSATHSTLVGAPCADWQGSLGVIGVQLFFKKLNSNYTQNCPVKTAWPYAHGISPRRFQELLAFLFFSTNWARIFCNVASAIYIRCMFRCTTGTTFITQRVLKCSARSVHATVLSRSSLCTWLKQF